MWLFCSCVQKIWVTYIPKLSAEWCNSNSQNLSIPSLQSGFKCLRRNDNKMRCAIFQELKLRTKTTLPKKSLHKLVNRWQIIVIQDNTPNRKPKKKTRTIISNTSKRALRKSITSDPCFSIANLKLSSVKELLINSLLYSSSKALKKVCNHIFNTPYIITIKGNINKFF